MDMPTIAQAQAAFLKEGDFGGIERTEAQELTDLERAMSEYIVRFLSKASDNLNATNSITTGNLEKSLSFDITKLKGGYRIDFKALEYFKYVDKGVRGAGASRKNNDSPYKFKKINPSKDHVTAIEKWIVRNRLTARAKDLKGRTKRESKAIDPTKSRKTLAFLIARSIKREGLYETGFWSDAFDETFRDFGANMSQALGKTIVVDLQKMKEDLANFKGKGTGKGVKIPR